MFVLEQTNLGSAVVKLDFLLARDTCSLYVFTTISRVTAFLKMPILQVYKSARYWKVLDDLDVHVVMPISSYFVLWKIDCSCNTYFMKTPEMKSLTRWIGWIEFSLDSEEFIGDGLIKSNKESIRIKKNKVNQTFEEKSLK